MAIFVGFVCNAGKFSKIRPRRSVVEKRGGDEKKRKPQAKVSQPKDTSRTKASKISSSSSSLFFPFVQKVNKFLETIHEEVEPESDVQHNSNFNGRVSASGDREREARNRIDSLSPHTGDGVDQVG